MKRIKAQTKLNNNENKDIKILGLANNGENSDEKQAYIALKYFDKNFECFSEWSKDELACFSNFIDKINNLTWNDIKRHTGLRYKMIDNAKGLPENSIKEKISKDISFYELRVSQKARVVGFRQNAVFFICWLDRNHRICPE
jgi:hypothetical protein|nr:MAG TPA: hypothetical protein [Caudoviricetes sp.]